MKTVLITGASRGIGKGIARAAAKLGYNIIINYNKSEKQAKELETELSKITGVLAVKADITNNNEIKEMLNIANKRFGHIDYLVNNAGFSWTGLFIDITDEKQDKIIDTNLKGMLNVTRAVLPSMLNRKSGKIVNISSMWGLEGASCEVHYSATKSAVIGFTKALAKEVAPSGVNVNCVCPGVIDTEMLNNLNEDDKQELANDTPFGRLGTPEDIANAVMFFLSEKSSFITGQSLLVDGGYL